jgi:outer membrane lipopolysaccharide assembly protein LptE/RlpB
LKTPRLFLPLCAVLLFFLTSCGYHNPYVYSGPEKTIYISEWKNRTSELSLDSDIYRSLARWYQKAGSLHVSKNKEGANLILAGEIVSISLPSRSYGANRQAAEVEVRLRVRYILKDITSGKILLQEPSEYWTESYLTSTNPVTNKENEKIAIRTIISDLSQKIYQRTLVQIPKL